jgi:hypothetical protein
MCGASSEQMQLQQEQMDAYKQAQDLTAKQYANQQAIFAPMATQFQSILSRGPNQAGFSDEERQDLNASAVEGTAENYEHAARAVNENLAARGGGNMPLTSGADAELKSEVAQSSAAQESNEQSQIKLADYDQGFKEWKDAGAGLETIAAGQNPLGYESAATDSGSAASKTAESISAANNSWINAAIGAVGSTASGWAEGGFKH